MARDCCDILKMGVRGDCDCSGSRESIENGSRSAFLEDPATESDDLNPSSSLELQDL